MEPLGSGHRDPEGGAANIRSSMAAAVLGCELKNKQDSVFQFASGKDVFVCLPTGYVMASHCAMKSCPSIDSVDIKYAICGRINCIPLQRKAVTGVSIWHYL